MKFKDKVKEFARTVDAKGRERITIMFVPHSQKKIKSFHISYYAIFTSVAVIGVLSFLSFSLMTGTSMRANERSFLTHQQQEANYQIGIFRDKVRRFTNEMKYRSDLSRLFVSAGFIRPGDSILAMGGRDDEITTSNDTAIEGEDFTDLENVVNELSLSRRYMDKIQQYIRTRKSFIDCIPHLWPLPPGTGVIAKHFSDKDRYADRGLYIDAMPGTPLRAAANGTVASVEHNAGGSVKLSILHQYGFKTVYCGVGKTDLKPGRAVTKGEIIGAMASTGKPLLYQIIVASTLVDPESFITGNY
ncbi:MAG: M23 family metallopeptidase [Spirochaetes bacterium]|nr:M23 family metallopeptidase [Spirochaetota bacterium]